KDVVVPGAVVLSGSAMGIVKPKERLIMADKIQHGDAIIFLASSGIHANGLTMARKIASKLPDGYMTKLPGGLTYGDMLLNPTHIYVGLVEDCLDQGIDIHYAVNITGHGWRKLMRAPGNFTYVIDRLHFQPSIFSFLQEHGPVTDIEAYGNFNMGAGFALYIPEDHLKKFWEVVGGRSGNHYPYSAHLAGHIEKSATKRVIIMPNGISYSAETLGVR
ncbi:MAG: AIR synthase-related protein, partial [Rectinemataceae bacterium]|nr:AIR synthase-related protein [Rectinemataceae bacterium]